MPVQVNVAMLSKQSDTASSARGLAGQEMKMWESGGGVLIQETGGHVLRSLEGEGHVDVGVCDEARKITDGFDKMEASHW